MKAAGIIFPNLHDKNIAELTKKRTMASVPFGCRYRLIDIPLSNMVNCGISNIQYRHSLVPHAAAAAVHHRKSIAADNQQIGFISCNAVKGAFPYGDSFFRRHLSEAPIRFRPYIKVQQLPCPAFLPKAGGDIKTAQTGITDSDLHLGTSVVK